MNIREGIVRVRERIHDRDARAFDDAEILRAFDDAVSEIFTILRTHGDSHGLDYEDVLVTSLTQLETDVYQYETPEYLHDPQLIELINAGRDAYPLVKAPLELKDQARGVFPGSRAVWHWGPKGSIQIRGKISGFTTVRFWFIRLIAPLFYAVGSGASNENTIYVVQEDGTFKAGDGMYPGQLFEATSGPNLGLVRRCLTHLSEVLTVATFPYSMANEEFAMVIPVPPEHRNYLVTIVTAEMMTRQGSEKERAMAERKLEKLQTAFEMGIASRASGEPCRFYSSRTVR